MPTLKPLNDRIVVERDQAEEKTAGGIVLPDTAKDKPKRGKIVAVGTGHVLDDGKVVPMELKKGETVLFGPYSGMEIKIDGKELLILKESEVLGVLEK